MQKSKKIFTFLCTAAYFPLLMQVQVFAYSDQESSSDGTFLPIILPFVVTGFLILQSRTKQKNISAHDYFNGNVDVTFKKDDKRSEQEKTSEPANTSLKKKISEISKAQDKENNRAIIGAIGENISSSEQLNNLVGMLSKKGDK